MRWRIPFKKAARYLVNRPLMDYEKQRRLSPKERSISPPWYQISVIKMNSTFLECTDDLFGMKGMCASIAMFAIGMGVVIALCSVIFTILDWSVRSEHSHYLLGVLICCAGIALIMLLSSPLLKQDCYGYTHYPIRFNRKNRKIYAFRWDGTMMEANWDELYVAPIILPNATGRGNDYEICLHRISEDGETVLDSYSLPWKSSDDETLYCIWEFVRRYMEEPEELPHLSGQVEFVMDIAERRETWWWGFKRLLAAHCGPVAILYVILAPIIFICSFGRWIAMHACAIPQWPAEVEAECQIEPNDPYLRDRDHLAAPGTVERPPLPR